MARPQKTLAHMFQTFLTFALSLCAAAPLDEPILHTENGAFRGIHSNEHVDAFLGIPYAKPPVGELRWEVPHKLDPAGCERSSVIDATQFGPSCHQFRYHDILMENVAPRAPESEDCLYLNVFVPRRKHDDKRLLPTLVWMNGGAFGEGDGSARAYNPTNLVASQGNIAVVTLNYRLSIFGFPNSPGIAIDRQNLGIRDMRAALEWLRENLHSFGGDPSRITLGGQSAGADAAVGLTYAFPDDPIASALLLESGQPLALGSYGPQSFFQAANVVGCRNASSPKTELGCMKTVPPERIQAALSNRTLNAFGTTGGMPMVDNLTVFMADEYQRRGNAGKFAQVPLFIGMNNQDGNGALNWTPKCGVNQTLADIFTTTFFECPISAEASYRTKYSVPVWRYRYMGKFEADTFFPWVGSYHTAEIPFILGSYPDLIPSRPVRRSESKAARFLQDAVGTFVRDPAAGLQNRLGWPQYNTNETTLIEIFRDNKPSSTLQDPGLYNAVCADPPTVPIEEFFAPAPSC